MSASACARLARASAVATLLALLFAAFAQGARAESVHVAVAANFTEAAKEIGALFEQATGHRAIFSFGATGHLYTQISQDAPFDVFLAADNERPAKAIADGLAMAGTRFTYATGRIVLYSRDTEMVSGEATLKNARFSKIAIANPATAPYGAAAIETMKALNVYEALKDRIVQGNSIAQTFQFVSTGNAELGFVALSQVIARNDGSRWIVPANLYTVIAQDAVLLKKGAANPAARAFLAFLRGPEAGKVKEKFGYGAGD